MSFAQWSQNPQAPIPPSPSPAARLPWHRRTGWVIAALLLLPPLGWILACLKREWTLPRRLMATGLSVVWLLVILPSGGGSTDPDNNGSTGKNPAATVSAKATPSPAARTAVQVPEFVGESLSDAKSAAVAAGFARVTSHDASDGDSGQLVDSNWTVCFQKPKSGTKSADPASTAVALGVVRTGDPCPASDGEPIPYPKMPDVVGKTYEEASEALADLGLTDVDATSAFTDVDVPNNPADWKVCFQHPAAGKKLTRAESTSAELSLVRPTDTCPGTEHTRRHTPAPDPAPDPDRGSSTGGGSSSGGGGGGGGGGGVGTVHPGAFCSPPGAIGTSNGKLYTCKGPGQNRWRR
ncbi:PASTA domain-containing protein [Streptomyces triticagri]|uniref:PASTA domain-containing protein n=1 Tax=Streptomyces triticagri TaxID=2293568 RepID=A0A372LX04_9ACTN|nr:PASTA domain-containing protein [Streptomyces triticagri]RFU82803.1 PASTA domain-containing protein [Streptomyces triticagri]